MAEFTTSMPTAATGRDAPGVGLKVLLLVCLAVAAVIVDGWWKLAVLLAVSAGCVGMVAVRPGPRRPGTLVWAGVGLGGLAVGLWAWGLPVRPYAGPVARLVILLVAGRAFALSTSAAEWRRALDRARLPNRMVLLFAAAHAMTGMLASEVRFARQGMRIRAMAEANGPDAGRLHRLWRAGVAFCARLFARADRLTALAETRAFSRPGRRWLARPHRSRACDLLVGVSCVAATAILCLV